MKKKLFITLIVILFISVFILSTCASVNTQGINYFVGRTENDLINYFGYNGVVQSSDGNNEYDKIVFFTNKVIKYQVSKVNTVQYKVKSQTQIMFLEFNAFSDGCVVYKDARYYGMHKVEEGAFLADGSGRYIVHRNDNATLRPKINQFNNIINSYTSYPTFQENEAFNKSRIGDSYYIYKNNIKSYWSHGTRLIQPESYTENIWELWKIDIVAKNRSETEGYIIAQYYERQDQYYSGNGDSVITVPQINNLINDYKNKGFIYTTNIQGHSLLAYIKNGKVIKVEKK
ncbi:MAG: hypothetical protein LBV17_02610 [Treponema sp.]|jgi:hypothetical protein|nr:hypothetical protein [Treponema sp.]